MSFFGGQVPDRPAPSMPMATAIEIRSRPTTPTEARLMVEPCPFCELLQTPDLISPDQIATYYCANPLCGFEWTVQQ